LVDEKIIKKARIILHVIFKKEIKFKDFLYLFKEKTFLEISILLQER
jgi:hypothetical protein